jgi:hypothetical protein
MRVQNMRASVSSAMSSSCGALGAMLRKLSVE